MGMPITVEVLGDIPDQTITSVFDYFRHIDDVFSTYKPDSQISRLNRGELAENGLSDEVRDILAACERMKLRTKGYFDISHNGVTDPSGLVKGWAVWNAAQIIEKAGYRNYFVEAGGDIQAGGFNSRGKKWTVGIRHPIQKNKFAKTIEVTDSAVATSGTYERGRHIYHPQTGRAVEDPLSLTVIGPNIEEADVIATAAFAMGPQRALGFVAGQGFEGYMITKDLKASFTAGFENYVKN